MTIETSIGKGAMLAVGAAALILAGCASSGTNTAASNANVACVGANTCKGTSACKTQGNSCKGQNACKTANNACKGQSSCKTAGNLCKGMNACKGHGHLSLSAAECAEKSGHPA